MLNKFIEVQANKASIVRRKLVHGIGINDSTYKTQFTVNGKDIRCPYYEKWRDMIKRCYNEKSLKKKPTYIGCTVCSEWLLFSNFKEWMVTQDWEGKELDKDIIKYGNKVYCPETCCFVSHDINSIITPSRIINTSKTSKYIGVYFNKKNNTYTAYCSDNNKSKYLGSFKKEAEARKAYVNCKRELIINYSEYQDDTRIKKGLITHANML